MKKLITLIAVFSFMLAGAAFAEASSEPDTALDAFTVTIDDICEVAVTGALGDFTVQKPATPGDPFVVSAPDSNTYIQYTSCVAEAATRILTADLDTVYSGLTIKIKALDPAGSTQGEDGTVSEKTYTPDSHASQNLITAIGSCYTGTEATDGAQTIFTLSVEDADVGSLFQETEAVTINVTYVLTTDV